MYGANSYDFAVDIGEVWDTVVGMSWCHRSQVVEWLPWVGRHNIAPAASVAEWAETMRRRFERQNIGLGIASPRPVETFRVTAWGAIPTFEQLVSDFPIMLEETANSAALRERLKTWKRD